MARTRIIGVRVNQEESEQFERACKAKELVVSEWLRELGRAEIRGTPSTIERVRTAQEIKPNTFDVNSDPWDGAEGEEIETLFAPGILEMAAKADAGIGRSVAGFLMDSKTKISAGVSSMEGTEAVAPKSLSFLNNICRLTQGDANEELLARTKGKVPPADLERWHGDRKIRWKLGEWLDKEGL